MSNQEDYAAKLAAAQKLKPEELKQSYIPIGIAIQEAEDLCHWAKPDLEKLQAAGLNPELLEDLPVLAGALREAQSLWMRDVQLREAAEQEWAERSPLAFDTRDRMLHAFRYAFRKDAAILITIDAIAEGGGNADMVQDLNDLAVLGKQHSSEITAIGITVEEIEGLATLSDEMGALLARANGERESINASRDLRDRFYTLMKQVVDEVRDCGKYVFWRDTVRYKGYTSRYNRQHHRRGSTTETETPQESMGTA